MGKASLATKNSAEGTFEPTWEGPMKSSRFAAPSLISFAVATASPYLILGMLITLSITTDK